MNTRRLRVAVASLAIAAAAFGVALAPSAASAKPIDPGFGKGHWGHHHHHGGIGGRRFWGPRFAGYYGAGCFTKRYGDFYGDIVLRRVCY